MKYISFLSLLFFCSCQSQKSKDNIAPDYIFKGQVKSMTHKSTREFEEEFGEIKSAEFLFVDTYEYNEEGYLTKKIKYNYLKATPDSSSTIYLFDENNLALGQEFYDGDKLSSTTEFVNDANGLMQQKIHHFSSGKNKIIRYEYDSNGYKTLVDEVLSRGRKYITRYQNDEQGNVIEETISSDDELTHRFYNKYNEKNQLYLKIEHNYRKQSEEETIYKYNEKGLLIELRKSAKNTAAPFQETISYQYDDFENLIEEITSHNNRSRTKIWVYEYDDIGNWISRIAYRIKDELKYPEEVSYRTFEYY